MKVPECESPWSEYSWDKSLLGVKVSRSESFRVLFEIPL